MLENLHVKNLALIEEEDITFLDGLHILSGETGAGKSIILGGAWSGTWWKGVKRHVAGSR